ncbi:MAG: hypothetical protein BYD32DRAFT_417684 [Podila humilis]|nr:MAG: hypothetical protein BYD32DRAFT_417684 [Podila humilis]
MWCVGVDVDVDVSVMMASVAFLSSSRQPKVGQQRGRGGRNNVSAEEPHSTLSHRVRVGGCSVLLAFTLFFLVSLLTLASSSPHISPFTLIPLNPCSIVIPLLPPLRLILLSVSSHNSPLITTAHNPNLTISIPHLFSLSLFLSLSLSGCLSTKKNKRRTL